MQTYNNNSARQEHQVSNKEFPYTMGTTQNSVRARAI